MGTRVKQRALLALPLAMAMYEAKADAVSQAWPFVGGDLHNARSAAGEHVISPATVAKLAPDWSVRLRGAVKSATVVSDGQSLFVPTANGLVYRIDRQSGQIISQIDLAATTGIPGAFSKASVAVAGDTIVVGLENKPVVAAFNKDTGSLVWQAQIDDHPGAVVTQSPIVAEGRVFIGVSGLGEESQATFPSYKCCSFRGSEVALDARNGKMLWKTYTIPPGYAGASIWSNAATYDAKRHSLYVTTGNEFQVPDGVQRCVDRGKNDARALVACYPPGVWYDSILALDPDTGRIKWGHRFDDYDIFTGACLVPENHAMSHCGHGEDFDFGNGAMLWHQAGSQGGRDLLGAGQKAGMFWAVDPDNGSIVWRQRLGPGGPVGGVEFGSAADGKRVYAAEANTKGVGHDPGAYTLPSGQTIKYGSFAAMDGATGRILWQVPDPAGAKFPGNNFPCKVNSPKENCTGAYPRAAVTIANGVVFGCSEEPEGHMYAFDATSGALLWSYASGFKCSAGASVVDGEVYWASGQTLFAFAPNGRNIEIVARDPAPTHRTIWAGVFSAQQAQRGRNIYLQSCAQGCHLENLAGNGPSVDLAGAAFMDRWNGLSVGDLVKKIETTMPKTAPGSLMPDDYLAVAAYLLSANGCPPGGESLEADPAALAKLEITPAK